MLEIAFPWRKPSRFFVKTLARFILYVFQFFPIESHPVIALSNVSEQLINDFFFFLSPLASIQFSPYLNSQTNRFIVVFF
jgi:hypothetical protein